MTPSSAAAEKIGGGDRGGGGGGRRAAVQRPCRRDSDGREKRGRAGPAADGSVGPAPAARAAASPRRSCPSRRPSRPVPAYAAAAAATTTAAVAVAVVVASTATVAVAVAVAVAAAAAAHALARRDEPGRLTRSLDGACRPDHSKRGGRAQDPSNTSLQAEAATSREVR
jgi:hypothetical protein